MRVARRTAVKANDQPRIEIHNRNHNHVQVNVGSRRRSDKSDGVAYAIFFALLILSALYRLFVLYTFWACVGAGLLIALVGWLVWFMRRPSRADRQKSLSRKLMRNPV
jgi:hypothetical protein